MSATSADVARRWFEEVWNQRKASTITELMHPSAEGHTSDGLTKGPDEWKRRMWDRLTGAFSSIKVSVDDLVSKDETVVVRWSATMVHTGDALGIPPSGKTVSITGITWLIVREGRLMKGWDGWDATGMLLQCGGATLHPALSK